MKNKNYWNQISYTREHVRHGSWRLNKLKCLLIKIGLVR